MSTTPSQNPKSQSERAAFNGWRDAQGGPNSVPRVGPQRSPSYGRGSLKPLQPPDPTLTGNHRYLAGTKVNRGGLLLRGAHSGGRPRTPKPGHTSAPAQQPTQGSADKTARKQAGKPLNRAKRFRGGRMGGGTLGWGYGDPGDSDEAGESEAEDAPLSSPEAPPEEPKLYLTPADQSWRFTWHFEAEDANRSFWEAARRMYPHRADPFRICLVFTRGPRDELEHFSYHETLEMDGPVPVADVMRRYDDIYPVWRIVPCFDTLFLRDSRPVDEAASIEIDLFNAPTGRPGEPPDAHLVQLGLAVRFALATLYPEEFAPEADDPILRLHDENSARLICELHPDNDPMDLIVDCFWSLTSPHIVVSRRSQPYKPVVHVIGPEDEGESEVISKNQICGVLLCNANLGLMTREHQGEHEQMHAITRAFTAQMRRKYAECRRKNAEIQGVQEDFEQLRQRHTDISQQFAAALEILQRIERARVSMTKSSNVSASPKPATKASSQLKPLAIQKNIPATVDATHELPPPLPSDISIPVTRKELYNSDRHTSPNLRPLRQANICFCNVCLIRCWTTKEFAEHAQKCKTSPWNFVTLEDKKSLANGKTRFAHRFPEAEHAAGAEAEAESSSKQQTEGTKPASPRPNPTKTTRSSPRGSGAQPPPGKKRKESQQAYKDDGDDDDDDDDNMSTTQPETRPRKRRRESQAAYQDPPESQGDVHKKKQKKQ